MSRYSPLSSSTSSRREGNLSIVRLISRVSQGSGLRSAILPSLSMITKENPLGRSFLRRIEVKDHDHVAVLQIAGIDC